MSNNKKSSIYWLICNIYLKDSLKWEEVIEQAVEMHKDEIEESYHQGYESGMDNKELTARQYYNETFNNDESI